MRTQGVNFGVNADFSSKPNIHAGLRAVEVVKIAAFTNSRTPLDTFPVFLKKSGKNGGL